MCARRVTHHELSFVCLGMRTGNLVVTGLGVAAVAMATGISWRWRRLPLIAARQDRIGWRAALADAATTLGAILCAGALSGLLVLGLGGRLVMRLLAATSGRSAQGRLTEAGERVGEVTTDGTIGFLLFVGLGGGLVTAIAFLLIRRWLPSTAGKAGLVTGLLLTGTLGVSDPLSPDNVDFSILRPTWLAVVVVAGAGLLFATTYTALAARLDHLVAARGRRRWLPCASLALVLLPPLPLLAIGYVGGRAAAQGRVRAVLTRPRPTRAGHVLLGAATFAAVVITGTAIARIAIT